MSCKKDHMKCWDRTHCIPTVLERFLAEAVSHSFVTPFDFLDMKGLARSLALLTADCRMSHFTYTLGCERDIFTSASGGSQFEPCRFWDRTLRKLPASRQVGSLSQ